MFGMPVASTRAFEIQLDIRNEAYAMSPGPVSSEFAAYSLRNRKRLGESIAIEG